MNSTQNNLQKRLGEAEYDRLLSGANQINIFGKPVKELSREELLAALTLTVQANQESEQPQISENRFDNLPQNTRTAGLW